MTAFFKVTTVKTSNLTKPSSLAVPTLHLHELNEMKK
jgi:hypothetical protein